LEIFKAHQDNILLEFSATIELDKKEIKEKPWTVVKQMLISSPDE
jgi:hypothetical protein